MFLFCSIRTIVVKSLADGLNCGFTPPPLAVPTMASGAEVRRA